MTTAISKKKTRHKTLKLLCLSLVFDILSNGCLRCCLSFDVETVYHRRSTATTTIQCHTQHDMHLLVFL